MLDIQAQTLPPFARPRRLRMAAAARSMMTETRLLPSHIIAPLFITEVPSFEGPIHALPGIYRYNVDALIYKVESLAKKGIDKIALFPLIDPAKKSEHGDDAYNPFGVTQTAIATLKKHFPSILLFADVALDPFTTHGHDGVVLNGQIDNDATLSQLIKQALSLAEAGADFIAPSDMMDGRVACIRNALDAEGFASVGILSYAAKYASKLYGPFRSAINTKLSFGDKTTYQLNPANVREALLEAAIDEKEGADMLMIKPALSYLDIIHRISSTTLLPVGGYHVSGEYAMVMAAHKEGLLDGPAVLHEHLLSIIRAGATFIYTYAYDHIS